MGRDESRRGTARAGRRSAGDGALLSSLTLLEVETERRERKRAGGAGDFGRGRERRAGLGLLVEWAHGDGHTPATAWRAAAAATVELNQGSVHGRQRQQVEPSFLPKSHCNVSIDQYKS